MALRFVNEFYSTEGTDWKIEIHDSDFVGDAVNFKSNGFTLQYENQNKRNLVGALMSSTLEFEFIIEIEGGQEGLIDDLIASSETRFSVVVYLNAAIWWTGAIVPDVGTIADEYYPYSFTITAVCGLGLLADYEYVTDTPETTSDSKWLDTFTGFDTLLTIIARCLKKLPHVVTHYTGADPFLKTAVNWYDEDLTYGALVDPLKERYLLNSLFSNVQTSGNAKPDSCADVIEKILDCFNARITQVGGAWVIEQYETRSNLTDNKVRSYAYDLTGQAASSVATELDINPAGDGVRIRGAQFSFAKALKKTVVTLNAQTRYNLAAAARFDQDSAAAFNAGNVFWVNTTTTFRAKGSISGNFENINIPDVLGLPIAVSLIFKLTVNLNSNWLDQDVTYLGLGLPNITEMVWEGLATGIEIPVELGFVPDIGENKDFSQEFDFVINTPAGTQGNLTINFELLRVVNMATNATVTDTLYAVTWKMNNPYFAIFFDEDLAIGKQQIEAYNDSYIHTGSLKLETFVGDAIGVNDLGALRREDTGSYFETDNWQIRDTAVVIPTVSELLARQVLAAHSLPVKIIRGTVYSTELAEEPIRALEYETKIYLFIGGTFNAVRDELQGEWMQASYVNPDVTVVINADSDTSSYNPPPVITNTTNQNTIIVNPAVAISDALNTLTEYDSDADAATGGVLVNGWYIAGSAHDRAVFGTITRRLE